MLFRAIRSKPFAHLASHRSEFCPTIVAPASESTLRPVGKALAMVVITPLIRSLHLLTASFASLAPLVAAWMHCRAASGKEGARGVGLKLASWSLISLGLALVTGVLLGLIGFSSDDNYGDIIKALRRKMEWGLAELAFSAALLYAFIRWWKNSAETTVGKSRIRCALAILAGTNLAYHMPLLFAVMDHLRTDPDLYATAITAADFRGLMMEPVVYTKALHVILAGLTLGLAGVMLAEPQELKAVNSKPAARLMMPILGIQFLLGLAMIIVMPGEQRKALMGMGTPAPWMLTLAVVLFIFINMTVMSAAAPEGDGSRRKRLAWLLVSMFVIMSIISSSS